VNTTPGIEMADPVYAARISELVASMNATQLNHPGYRGPLKLILSVLGCHSTVPRRGELCIVAPPIPDPCNEALVTTALLQVLRTSTRNGLLHGSDNFALLHGLSLNQRWRHGLLSEEDAHCLAALCVWHMVDSDAGAPASRTVRGVVEARLRNILKHWLQFDLPDLPLQSTAAIGSAFFGEAWHHLCIEQTGVWLRQVPRMVYHTRPPFKPGLLSCTTESFDVTLPALENP
jgi:hypothetical protein